MREGRKVGKRLAPKRRKWEKEENGKEEKWEKAWQLRRRSVRRKKMEGGDEGKR